MRYVVLLALLFLSTFSWGLSFAQSENSEEAPYLSDPDSITVVIGDQSGMPIGGIIPIGGVGDGVHPPIDIVPGGIGGSPDPQASAELPDAYPWQLTDFTGVVGRKTFSNFEWNNFERLEAGTHGGKFTWDNWPAYVTQVGNDSAQQLYSQTFYTAPDGRKFNFQSYNLDSMPVTDLHDLSGVLFSLNGNGSYKKIMSELTKKPIRSFYGVQFCGSFDPFWLFAGDTWMSTYDLSFAIESTDRGRHVLKDQSGHYPYYTPAASTRGDSICGKGLSINDPNKFFIKRLTQHIPQVLAYYPVDSMHGGCDDNQRNCGVLNNTSYVTDRFGRANSALGLNKENGSFILPSGIWDKITNKENFTVGFWARVKGDHQAPEDVGQNGLFASMFFGMSEGAGGKPLIPMGLSFAEKEMQLSINRSSVYTSGSSHEAFDWKFWLPPEFNLSSPPNIKGDRWIYLMLAYDTHRTTVYMHDPLKTKGDFLNRFMHKYFILMNTDELKHVTKWGFGVPAQNVDLSAVEAIDDITIFNLPLEGTESYVRAALNETVLGNRPQ